jgi:uncharacterized delta-60 repeat protein
MRLAVAVTSLAAAIVAVPSAARAGPGDLDPSFGTNGTVTTRVGSSGGFAYALALQPDGKIVLGGEYNVGQTGSGPALARYDANGGLDTGFGTEGVVKGPSGLHAGRAIALQPDGKILLAGGDFAVARYRPDGSLDTSFGSEGIASAPGPDWSGANALAVQPDGKILVGGSYVTHDPVAAETLVRFNSNGSLDSTFGSGGRVTTSVGSGGDNVYALVVQPDGKILAAGGSVDQGRGYVTIVRYEPNGRLDQGFGSAGIVKDGDFYQAFGLALEPDGRILAAGMSVGPPQAFALARFSPDGQPDSSFGSGGAVITAIGSQGYAQAVAVQPDGKIVLAGSSKDRFLDRGFSDFAVARYDPNGSLDRSFGTDGTVTTSIGEAGAGASALALQPDGRIVVGGSSSGGFTLARYAASSPSTIEAMPQEVDYGATVQLSGTVFEGQAGRPVTLLGEACGDSPKPVTTVSTSAGGGWSASAQPVSTTAYRAGLGTETSPPATVGVRPRVTLERIGRRRFRARVEAAQSFRGEVAIVERYLRVSKRWVTVRRVFLTQIRAGSPTIASGATFTAAVGPLSLVRLVLPQSTAGPCYLPAVSNPVRG